MKALDRYRVSYIVIGGFARVIQGAEEMTKGVDIAPSTRPENLRRLEEASASSACTRRRACRSRRARAAREPVMALRTAAGELKVVPEA